MKTIRFFFYMICLVAAVAGAVFGIKVVGGHLIERFFHSSYVIHPDEFFRGSVILLLSLGLLVLLHIASRVADAFEFPVKERRSAAEPTVCLICRTAIPAGSAMCPKCGWSYADAKSP